MNNRMNLVIILIFAVYNIHSLQHFLQTYAFFEHLACIADVSNVTNNILHIPT